MDKISYSEKDELVFEKLANQGPLGKRALFIFQYLFLRKEFNGFIKKIREGLKIPEGGFDPHNKEDQKEFMDNRGYIAAPFYNGEVVHQSKIYFRGANGDIDQEIRNFIDQCGVLVYAPNMYLADSFISAVIREYILFNDFVGIYKSNFALTSVATYDQERDDQEPIELRLEIPISAKKEEIKDYIDSTWKALELARKNVLKKGDFVRFRPRQNFIRDLQIYNKYLEIENLSKNQRKEKMIEYIELGVLRELKQEGVKNLPDSGTVRSIVSKLRNEIKDKNSFWEEVDEEETVEPIGKEFNPDDF